MDIENNKEVKDNKPLLVGCGAIILLGIIAVVYFFIWIGAEPNSGVLFSNEMEEYALEYIKEHEILNSNEELIAYYDFTFSLDSTEAAILTNERIIYHKEGSTEAFNLIDIIDVKHRYEEINGDIIEITNNKGRFLKIEILPDDGGQSFYNALMGTLKLKGIE